MRPPPAPTLPARRPFYSPPSRIPSHTAIGLFGSSLFHVMTCISRQKHLMCSAEANHRECGQLTQIGETLGRRPGSRPATVGLSYSARSVSWGARSSGRSSRSGIAYLSTTFGKLSVSRDFDASRVDDLTRGLASFYKRRVLQTPGALFRLARSARIYACSLIDYDVMLSPVVAHTTPKLGHLSPDQDFETVFARLRNFACFTPLNNATGSPAMSLPLGSTSDGLPIGVHFSGRHGEERTLLELAYELEQSRPFRRIQAAPKQ